MNTTFLRFPSFREKAVTVSYDDGVISDRHLIDILSAHGLKGTFNLNSGNYEQKNENYIPAEELKSLYLGSGNEVAVHGLHHQPMGEIDDALAISDIINDRRSLERLFELPVRGMAYPNNSYNSHSEQILALCGIDYARTTEATGRFDLPADWLHLNPTCHHEDPRLPELMKNFLEEKPSWYYLANTPKMFYLWGHSYEFNQHENWSIIENFAATLGGHNEIWYATNGEIFRYVQAFGRLIFGANGDMIENPTATDVYLHYFEKDYLIPAGKLTVLK